MIDSLNAHAPLWQSIQPLIHNQRFPQACLFIGPRHANAMSFVERLIAMLLCEGSDAPCGKCSACHLVRQGGHPDIKYISPEAPGSAIKIELIRELQQDAYQTPQRGSRRVVVIHPADKLNHSAANALLKILEEPPSHMVFILMAEQVGSIPPTILSRCQKYTLPPPLSLGGAPLDYLMIAQFYPKESTRSVLFEEGGAIISALCELVDGKCSPCTLAAKWVGYDFVDLIWLLHLMTAQAIHYQLMAFKQTPLNEGLNYFSKKTQPLGLFNCLSEINAITKKVNHNLNMNQTLVLENLLLGYIDAST